MTIELDGRLWVLIPIKIEGGQLQLRRSGVACNVVIEKWFFIDVTDSGKRSIAWRDGKANFICHLHLIFLLSPLTDTECIEVEIPPDAC